MVSIREDKGETSVPTPRVSIGMPVYNGDAYLREAVDSLLAQTFSDFELIISDNASTDRTEEICRAYAERDQRIRYVRQPVNQGAFANFQYVLDLAVAKYFMWAAHDDVFFPQHLQQLVTCHESSECILVSSRPEHLELSTGRRYNMLKISEELFGHSLKTNFLALMKLHHWDYAKACFIYGLYRREQMVPFDLPADKELQAVGSDLLFIYKILAAGEFCYISETTWRRGERFFRDTSKPRETISFQLKSQLRLVAYWFASTFKSLDRRGIADAIDRYTAMIEDIYQDEFGDPSEDFMTTMRSSKIEIIKLLMPTGFWLKQRLGGCNFTDGLKCGKTLVRNL